MIVGEYVPTASTSCDGLGLSKTPHPEMKKHSLILSFPPSIFRASRLANTVAYAFTDAILVTPLGAISVVVW